MTFTFRLVIFLGINFGVLALGSLSMGGGSSIRMVCQFKSSAMDTTWMGVWRGMVFFDALFFYLHGSVMESVYNAYRENIILPSSITQW